MKAEKLQCNTPWNTNVSQLLAHLGPKQVARELVELLDVQLEVGTGIDLCQRSPALHTLLVAHIHGQQAAILQADGEFLREHRPLRRPSRESPDEAAEDAQPSVVAVVAAAHGDLRIMTQGA
eukprot:CAMPEP_0180657196 /NCGR_PEP_ID=MMETSP1037_2-20121125/56285_1 /TAXON_ID=632150 /ORGANISM="Azadinium spinosum, Strain 3D9" /LENGTH=121 /DNA_ID=CAMNT_0022683887 /DNA_START=193 /DNA_END=554 /DNA_ORIENTATION=+